MEPRPRGFAGHPVTLIQLSETEPDLLMYSVPAFVKKGLFIVEQLNGPFHKLLDASVSTARHILLDQGLKLRFEMDGDKRTVGGSRPLSTR